MAGLPVDDTVLSNLEGIDWVPRKDEA